MIDAITVPIVTAHATRNAVTSVGRSTSTIIANPVTSTNTGSAASRWNECILSSSFVSAGIANPIEETIDSAPKRPAMMRNAITFGPGTTGGCGSSLGPPHEGGSRRPHRGDGDG